MEIIQKKKMNVKGLNEDILFIWLSGEGSFM